MHSRSSRRDDRPTQRRVEQKAPKRDKGKQKQRQEPTHKDKDKNLALELWPPKLASSGSTPKVGASSGSTTLLQDPGGSTSPTLVGGRVRRSSVATVLGGVIGDRHRNFSSGTNTNAASSQSNSPTTEKPRPSGRFAMFLNSISHWRSGRYSPALSASSTSLGTGTPLSGLGTAVPVGRAIPGRGPGGKTMRSEEGLRSHHKKGATFPDGGGGGAVGGVGDTGMIGATALTSERRASSWGQGDQPVEFMGMDLGSYRLNPVCAPNGGWTRKVEGRDDEREGEGGPLSSNEESGLVSSSSSSSAAAVFIIGAATRDRDRRPLSMFPAATESPSAPSSLVRTGGGAVDAASVASGSRGDVESFGPACFDEDSSTIASAFGDGEREGHRQGEEGEGEGPGSGGGSWKEGSGGGGSHDPSEGGDDFEEEEVDSDDTDEVPVTFSPRRRAAQPVER